MANYYDDVCKRIAKFLKRSKRAKADLIIQRNGDYVYLCDGHLLVKVSYSLYHAYVRKVDGMIYDNIDDGTTTKGGERVAPMNFSEIMNTDYIHVADHLPILLTCNDGRLLDVFVEGNRSIHVDHDFIKTLDLGAEWCTMSENKNPAMYSRIDDIEVICLPVNNNIDYTGAMRKYIESNN